MGPAEGEEGAAVVGRVEEDEEDPTATLVPGTGLGQVTEEQG